MIWFTADHHFGHTNIIEKCDRPFKTVEEMDVTLINNWNEVVKKQDRVYHLGDFAFSAIEKYRRRLNGDIVLIRGHHDPKQAKTTFGSVFDLRAIKIDKQKIVLCHYPLRTWEGSSKNSIHLHGHSHGRLIDMPGSLDVGVDCWQYYPISYEKIKQILRIPNGQ